MEAKASPRKPKVCNPAKSSKLVNLLVACRAAASAKSDLDMPHPLSVIVILERPPFSIWTTMFVLRIAKRGRDLGETFECHCISPHKK